MAFFAFPRDRNQAMRRSGDEIRRHIQALTEFQGAIATLFEISDFNPDAWGGQPTIAPKAGRETDWYQTKAAIDRVAPKAARSFAAAGSFVSWKPRGTMNTHPINPAIEWGTILDPDPKFRIDVLEACLNQALGALEDRLQNPPTRAAAFLSGIEGRHVSAMLKRIFTILGPLIVAGIVAGIVVAGIVYALGWS